MSLVNEPNCTGLVYFPYDVMGISIPMIKHGVIQVAA